MSCSEGRCLARRGPPERPNKRQYYGRKAKWTPRPARPKALAEAPIDYDQWLIELRSRLGLSQSELAAAIGAAGKAVVYQWETRKRVPSAVLWSRLVKLFA